MIRQRCLHRQCRQVAGLRSLCSIRHESILSRAPIWPYTPYRLSTLHANKPGLHRSPHPLSTNHSSASPGTDEHTIYALSTAPGRAALATIRITGPLVPQIHAALCPSQSLPRPRHASLRTLHAPHCPPLPSTVLDHALVLYFPAPHSVTGEDVLELHCHGGTAIVRSVLAAIPLCASTGRIRYAEAGEFTRRAFFNSRLDLVQVEALGDALDAVTEQQRLLSVRGQASALGNKYEAWRDMLVAARGELEALIDFSEDQYFDESPKELISNVERQVMELRGKVGMHIANAKRGELVRAGIKVALLGAPNAGKSSLLNRIVGREAAIVSGTAGTTRDVVEVAMDVAGWLCRFADTAGLRRALAAQEMRGAQIEEVEKEGMKRARARAADSDLIIVVLSFEADDTGVMGLSLDAEVTDMAERLLQEGRYVLVVINKKDRQPKHISADMIAESMKHEIPSLEKRNIHFISCTADPVARRTGIDDGLSAFMAGMTSAFAEMTSAMSDDAHSLDADKSIWQESLGATERQRVLLEECAAHLDAFTGVASAESIHKAGAVDLDSEGDEAAQSEVDFVLAAEHLRNAAQCLARITGKEGAGDVEEVLGVVFEKFCVGK